MPNLNHMTAICLPSQREDRLSGIGYYASISEIGYYTNMVLVENDLLITPFLKRLKPYMRLATKIPREHSKNT